MQLLALLLSRPFWSTPCLIQNISPVDNTKSILLKMQLGETSLQPYISATQDQHFKVSHAIWVGQCRYALAQVSPLQECHLAPVGGAFCVRCSELVDTTLL